MSLGFCIALSGCLDTDGEVEGTATLGSTNINPTDIGPGPLPTTVVLQDFSQLPAPMNGGCNPNEILEWTGTNWNCIGTPSVAGGAATSVPAAGVEPGNIGPGVFFPTSQLTGTINPASQIGAGNLPTGVNLSAVSQLPGPFNGTGCGVNEILQWNGSAWICIAIPTGADNLGNHTATTNLNLGNNQLVGNGGSSGISIDGAGNVGVGISAPTSTFHVNGQSRFNQGLGVGANPHAGNGVNIGASYQISGNTALQNGSSILQVGVASATAWNHVSLSPPGATNALYAQGTSGNIGIGTTTPNARMDISQSGAAPGLAIRDGINPYLITTDGTVTTKLQTGGAGGLVGTESGHNFDIRTNNVARMTFDTTGNVGIGTTTPTYSLDVESGDRIISSLVGSNATDSALAIVNTDPTNPSSWQIRSNANSSLGVGTEQSFSIYDARQSANRFIIDSSGRVGIGTNLPNRLLELAGPMRMTPAALPGSPAAGDIAIDSGDSNKLKFYDGTAWVDTSATGGSADNLGNHTATQNIDLGTNLLVGNGGSSGVAIDALGNVGFGTTSPSVNFQLLRPGATMAVQSSSAGAANLFVSNTEGSFRFLADNGYLHVRSETLGDRVMSFDSAGNVGIGTTTPNRLLEVAGPVRVSPTALPGTPAAGDIAVDSGDSNKLKFYDGTAWVDTSATGGSADNLGNHTATQNIDLGTNLLVGNGGTAGVAVDNVGNVGIGTATPGAKLHVVGLSRIYSSSATTAMLKIRNEQNTPADAPVLSLGRKRADAGGITSSLSGSLRMNLEGATADSEVISGQLLWGWENTQSNDTTDRDSYLSFSTTADNSLTEKVRITSAGNVGIGTASPNRLLEVAGPVRVSPTALPGTPAAGDIAVDSGDSNKLKFYDGTAWVDTSATGGSADNLGNHTATQNIDLGTNLLVGNGGTAGVAVDNVGNVGIGVATPGTKFHVANGNSTTSDIWNATSFVRVQNTSTTDDTFSSVAFVDGGNEGVAKVGAQIVDQTNHYGELSFVTRGSSGVGEKMRIDQDGNVGIGTTNPISLLHVEGQIRSKLESSAPSVVHHKFDRGGTGDEVWIVSDQDDDTNRNITNLKFEYRDNSAAVISTPIQMRQNNVAFGGNVGIGTGSPNRLLEVAGPVRFSPAALPGSPAAGDIAVDSGDSNKLKFYDGTAWVDTSATGGSADNLGNHTATQNIDLGTNLLVGNGGTAGVAVDASGNIGIGTSSPANLLHLSRSGSAFDDVVLESSSGGSPSFIISNAGHALVNGDMVGSINALSSAAVGTVGYTNQSSSIVFRARENHSPTTTGGAIDFITTENGTSGTGVRRMRIDHNGNVGIGNDDPASSLHIRKSAAVVDLTIQNESSTIGNTSQIFLVNDDSSTNLQFNVFSSGTPASNIALMSSNQDILVQSSGDLFLEANGNAVTLDGTTGNFGIGTGSPNRLLEVAGPVRFSPAALPGTPAAGDIAIDSGDSNKLKFYDGTAWVDTSATGGSTDNLGNHTATQNIDLGTNLLVGNGGTAGVAVDNVGNVGIGTPSPGQKLHVAGTTGAVDTLISNSGNGASDYAGVTLQNDTGILSYYWAGSSGHTGTESANKVILEATSNSSGMRIVAGGTNAIDFVTGGNVTNPEMVIANSGNVGIGTRTPNRLLEVAGPMRMTPAALPGTPAAGDIAVDSGDSNKLKYYDGSAWIDPSAGAADNLGNHTATQNIDLGTNLLVGNGGTAGITVDSSGDVGIGTTTPDNPLDVRSAISPAVEVTYTNASGGTALRTVSTDTGAGVIELSYNSAGTPQIVSDSGSGSGAYIETHESGVRKLRLGQTFIGGQSLGVENNLQIAIDANNDGTGAFEIAKGSWNGRLGADGTALLRVQNNGNVGIGTTTPNRLLEVAGPVRVSPTALPGTPAAGDIAVDSGDSNALKYYDGSSWVYAGDVSGIRRLGVWDALLNLPSLGNGGVNTSPAAGDYYVVISASPSTTLDGNTNWQVGDWVIFNGATWGKISNSGGDNLGNHTATTGLNLNNNTLSGISLGSASLPSFSFTSDTNTGIFSSGSDTLNLATAGNERIRIDSSGNVGVGTNVPDQKFVVGDPTNGPLYKLRDSSDLMGANGVFDFIRNGNSWTSHSYARKVYTSDVDDEHTFNLNEYIVDSTVDHSQNVGGVGSYLQHDSTSNFNGGMTAIEGQLRIGSTGDLAGGVGVLGSIASFGGGDITTAYGLYGYISSSSGSQFTTANSVFAGTFNGSGGTNTEERGLFVQNHLNVSSTTSTGYGIKIETDILDNFSTMTNYYALHLDMQNSGAGSYNNTYGIYLNDLPGAINQYAFYQGGMDDRNYFAGDVGIGDSTPNAKLHVTGPNLAGIFNRDDGASANVLTIRGTNSAGSGSNRSLQISFQTETSTDGNNQNTGGLRFTTSDVTAGSVDSSFELRTYNNGSIVRPIATDVSGNVGMGTTNPSSGTQSLRLDVEGPIGGTYYCDEDGNNCFLASDVAGGVKAIQTGTTNPLTANAGEIFYNTTDSTTYVYNGSAWEPTASSGYSDSVLSDSDPTTNLTSASAGDVAYNSTSGELEFYDGSSWVSTLGGGGGGLSSGDVIPAADGNATAPGISFSSDTDTGIYRSNGMNFTVGGTRYMRMETDGDVLIGNSVAAGTYPLEVNMGGGSNPGTSGSGGTGDGILRLSSLCCVHALDFGINGSGTSWIQSRWLTNYTNNQMLVFNPNGGNVGVGTLTPSATFDVEGDIEADSIHGVNQASNGTGGSISLDGGDVGGNGNAGDVAITGGTATGTGNGGNISITGGDADTNGNSGDITITTGRSIASDDGGDLILDTGSGGAGFRSGEISFQINTSEAMRIMADGKIGIGTTAMTHPLEMASGAHLNSAGVWVDASDESLKEQIEDLEYYGLHTIMQMRPRNYIMKESGQKQVGFIAQELLPILPEVVSIIGDRMGVAYGQITAVLVKAVQELAIENERIIEENEKLKARVAELEQKNKALEDRVTNLEARFRRLEQLIEK